MSDTRQMRESPESGAALDGASIAATDAPPQTFSYDVFISYSRRDIVFARALTKALEAYHPPRDLTLALRRVRVFRDEGDFTGVDYTRAIERHLGEARKLIVVCSPNARGSRYVDDEIRRFAALRGGESIIPVLLAGIPNNEATPERGAERAFPEALCEVVSMPLAADYRGFRQGKDRVARGGFENPWFTILANLYEVNRRTIEQREKKRQAHNRRIRNAVMSGIVAAISSLAVWALWERHTAIRNAEVALARQLAAQSDVELKQSAYSLQLSSLLAVASVTRAPTSEGVAALTQRLSILPEPPVVLLERSGEVSAMDPGGTVVIVNEPDRIVAKRLVDGEEVGGLSKHACGDRCKDILAIALSEAGNHMVIAARTTAKVFRLEQGVYVPTREECTLAGAESRIRAIAYSRDAQMLGVVSGRSDEWSMWLTPVASDGSCAGAGVDFTGAISEEPAAVAFSPDGATVAFGGTEFAPTRRKGFAGVWQVPRQATVQRGDFISSIMVEGHISRIVSGQRWSAEGGDRLLAAEVENSHVAVWREVNFELEELTRLPATELSLLGFTDGGSAVVLYDEKGGRVVAWPLPRPTRWEGGTALPESSHGIAFGQDGVLITATWRTVEEPQDIDYVPTISLWQRGSRSQPQGWGRESWSLRQVHPRIPERELLLSPDGRFVMVALDEGKSSIIDVHSRTATRSISLTDRPSIVALGPGANLFASVVQRDQVSSLALVDPSGRESPRRRSYAGEIAALAFSGDGRHLAIAVKRNAAPNVIIRLTVDAMKETARFNASEAVTAVAMNVDGTFLAAAGLKALNGTSAVSVWRVPLPAIFGFSDGGGVPVLERQVRAAESIVHVALSYDGRMLATASQPAAGVGPLYVLEQWMLAPDALVREACRRIQRDLTIEEWTTHLPGETYRRTCAVPTGATSRPEASVVFQKTSCTSRPALVLCAHAEERATVNR